MRSCFHYEKTKPNVLRPVDSELTWFHVIAHLFMFCASLKGNDHSDVNRAVSYTVEMRLTPNVPAHLYRIRIINKNLYIIRSIVAVFSMSFSFYLGYIGV